MAPIDGSQDADRTPVRGSEIDDRNANPDRRPPLFAGHAHDAAERLHQRIIAGAAGKRSLAAERTHGAVNQAWIELEQALAIEAEIASGARAKIMEEHVGIADQIPSPRCWASLMSTMIERLFRLMARKRW
ncbi:MAG: hypothetical protein U1E97_09945 [Alphaproteobacteria bacterium]